MLSQVLAMTKELFIVKICQYQSKTMLAGEISNENSPCSYGQTLTTEVSEAVPPHHLICYKKELALCDSAFLSANQVPLTALLCTSLHQTVSCSETQQFYFFLTSPQS
jgi:hypothetical protein